MSDPERKNRLLECAKNAKIYETVDPDEVKLVTDFIQYRLLKSEVEKLEAELRDKVENILLAQNIGVITTTEGMITAIGRTRETLDKRLIPDEVLDKAKQLTQYVELTTKQVTKGAV